MSERTYEEYAVFWGDGAPLAETSTLLGAEYAVFERRFRATFEPHSCFFEPLPDGEPQIFVRTVTTRYEQWRPTDGIEDPR